MRLRHFQLYLHYIWTRVNGKQYILHYFQSLTEENEFDPTYCSHWQLHCQPCRGRKTLPCWKPVKWKKQPAIIHLIAFIVIILIAFIWILFQMLAGTETSQEKKTQMCYFIVSHVSAVAECVTVVTEHLCQRPVWVHWHKDGLDQPQGQTYCPHYPPSSSTVNTARLQLTLSVFSIVVTFMVLI